MPQAPAVGPAIVSRLPADDSRSTREGRETNVTRIARLTAQLQGALDADSIVQVVVDHGVAAMQAQNAGLWMVEGDHVRLARTADWSQKAIEHSTTLPLSLDAPICEVVRERRAIYFATYRDYAEQYPASAERAKDLGGPAGGLALVPIARGDTVVAAMMFSWRERRHFDGDEREYFDLLASHVALALERARLFDAERAARTRFELLYGLLDKVARAEKLDAVFDASLDAVSEALGVSRSSILLFDETEKMRFRAWRGLSDKYRAAVDGHSPWKMDEPSPKPLFFADVERDEAMAPYRAIFAEEGIGSLGFVPLVHERRLIGKFMVYGDRPRTFAHDEIMLASALGTTLANAIVRRTAEDELRRTRDDALAAARARADLVAVVAHDLRNPLNVAKLKTQLVAMKNPDLVKDVGLVVKQLDHMNRLITGLLDAATIEGGRMTFERERHVAAEVAEEAIDLVRALADERGIKIVPPQKSGGEAVSCDRGRLLQVLSNLLGNALRFSPNEGFVVMTIEADGDDFVRFTVADEGPGIPPAERERVFERFVHGTSKPGLGLGLYIAKGVVTGHGGRIWIDPTPTGTRVAFTLPRA